MLKKKKAKESYSFLPNMNNKKEVMEYCRRRYPKGTKFISVSVIKDEDLSSRLVSSPKDFSYRTNKLIWAEPSNGQLYFEGKWAKIINDD